MALPQHPEFALSAVKQLIVDQIANGETMLKLEKKSDFPSRKTVERWRKLDREFDVAVTRARQCAGDAYAERVIETANDLISGYFESFERVQAARAAIDALKWAACKYYPKMYGSQDGPRTHTQVNVGEIKVLVSPEQRQAMIKARAELLGDTSEADASDDGMPEPEQEQPVDKDSG